MSFQLNGLCTLLMNVNVTSMHSFQKFDINTVLTHRVNQPLLQKNSNLYTLKHARLSLVTRYIGNNVKTLLHDWSLCRRSCWCKLPMWKYPFITITPIPCATKNRLRELTFITHFKKIQNDNFISDVSLSVNLTTEHSFLFFTVQ